MYINIHLLPLKAYIAVFISINNTVTGFPWKQNSLSDKEIKQLVMDTTQNKKGHILHKQV